MSVPTKLKFSPGSGFLLGIAAGGMMMFLGMLLFWIPPVAILMVLMAFLMPFVGPFITVSAPCPHCEAKVVMMIGTHGKKCPRCKHQLGVKDGHLVDYSLSAN